MNVTIFFGSETGNTEMLADDVAAILRPAHDVRVLDMARGDPSTEEPGRFWIILSSTYGDGDLPATAKPFAAKLEAERPSLDGRRYAIFGLGSSEYTETFGFGSRKLDVLLTELGAVRIGERHVHDVTGPHLAEDVAAEWLTDILGKAQTAA